MSSGIPEKFTMAARFTRQTKIGQMSPRHIIEVQNRLLLNENWREVAGVVTTARGEPMFNAMQIMLMQTHGVKAPAELIKSLMISGFTIGMLLNAVLECKLFFIADMLLVEVLGEKAWNDQPQYQEPASPVDNQAVSGRPFGHCSPHKPGEYIYFDPGTTSHAPKPPPPMPHSYSPPISNLPDQVHAPQFPPVATGPVERNEESDYEKIVRWTKNFQQLIGEGGSSVVYYGEKEGGRKIAVKRYRSGRNQSEEQFYNELKILPKLNHDNILPLLASASMAETPKCLIYPYMSHGSLRERLSCKNGSRSLDVQLRINIATTIAKVLVYLHDKGIVHRDVKSANILLDAQMHSHLADFGIARQSIALVDEQETDTMVVVGSLGYMPPESLEHHISTKLDVFSFGVILLEILTAAKPYDTTRDSDDHMLYDFVPDKWDEFQEGNFLDSTAGNWNKGTASTIFVLARKCLLRRKNLRPNMEQVVEQLNESYV